MGNFIEKWGACERSEKDSELLGHRARMRIKVAEEIISFPQNHVQSQGAVEQFGGGHWKDPLW